MLTIIAFTDLVKDITLSAAEDLIERARAIARAQRKTLNAVFREWLAHFAGNTGETQGFRYTDEAYEAR